MRQFEQLIVIASPVDDNHHLFKKANHLASQLNADLRLVCFEFNASLAHGHPLEEKASLEARSAYLQHIESTLEQEWQQSTGAQSKSIEIDVIWTKENLGSLLTLIDDRQTLLLKRGEHQGYIKRTFYSAFDWQLMHETKLPILFVQNNDWHSPLKCIACVDPLDNPEKPDDLDAKVLESLQALQSRMNLHYEVLHAYDPSPLMTYVDQPLVVADEFGEALEQQHLNALKDFLQQNHCQQQYHLLPGDPGLSIADFAQTHQVDMLVVGAHHAPKIDRWLFWHTAEKLIDHIDCDLLIVKPAS